MRRNLKSINVLILMVLFGILTTSAQIGIDQLKVSGLGLDKTVMQSLADKKKRNMNRERKDDPVVEYYLEEIEKYRIKIKSFNYKRRHLFPNGSSKLVSYAISKKARDKWFKKTFTDDQNGKNKLNSALDGLARAIAEKLPKYFPHKNNFRYRNAREEKMMMTALKKRINVKKLHMIGIRDRIWRIKKNEFGIPVKRYKEGFIWVQNADDDHPYCPVYGVDIIQDYAGGGTYGSKFAFVMGNDLYAC